MTHAYFGKPASTFVPGGTHVAVYLVPVFEGRLVVFDVTASAARGRWLPWDILEFAASPYEAAATLADEWCEGAVEELTLVDAMSFSVPGGGWELALVFRATLGAAPAGDDARTPFLFPEGAFDAIGNFDPEDLKRWVQGAAPPKEPSARGLLF